MLVPVSWLREFTDVDADAGQIAERLSLTGLAVDQVIEVEPPTGVVVGEVRSMREHPNADSLMLVVAGDGATEHDIVCGARNYAVGDRIPLALPGARLPNGMEIGAREVRGEPSNGMLCSAKELGLGEDHTGILLLDEDAPLGADLGKALELADVVLDIDITPNRPDALSIAGVAREVAAIFGGRFQIPAVELDESGAPAADAISITIEDAKGCPRYVGRVIRGVRHGRSPWWMRRRLLAAGMRPISTVVDITNYVMLERGQPLHAFDLASLHGPAIIVRKPRAGETITTLDDVERTLRREDVLICDADRPVAIGGVMGGAETEVGDDTTDVLLEAATFDPIRIARTSRRLGLRSEASYRFERGADPAAPPSAAARACALLSTLAGGVVAPGAVDVEARAIKRKPVRLRRARASTIIGLPQETAAMADMLRSLGCEIVSESRAALRAIPPTWRPDLTIEEDLIEEVARLVGYDRVPPTLPGGARTGGLTAGQRRTERARDLLAGAGLNEALTLTLLPPDLPDRLSLPADHPWRDALRLANPLSEEESVLRPALLPGLLQAARYNIAHGVTPVRLFELGTTFRPDGSGGCAEERRVAVVLTGPGAPDPQSEDRPLDFFDARGAIDALAAGLGVALGIEPGTEQAPFHPGRIARVTLDGRTIGTIAELHPRAAAALELPDRVAVAEVALDPIVAAEPTQHAPDVPRLPAVARDIALLVPEDVTAATVEATIAAAGGDLLAGVRLFDIYRGDQIASGNVSLAFELAFRHPERTLTDEEVRSPMEAIERAARDAGWTVRG